MNNHPKQSLWEFTKKSAREATREYFEPLVKFAPKRVRQTEVPAGGEAASAAWNDPYSEDKPGGWRTRVAEGVMVGRRAAPTHELPRHSNLPGEAPGTVVRKGVS